MATHTGIVMIVEDDQETASGLCEMLELDFLTEHRSDKALASIPVILVTAAVDATAKAADTGAVAVLAKPVDTVKLGSTVRQYC
jgi:CheY-like chemotaxis protein